jgi:glucans biosynthesis protein
MVKLQRRRVLQAGAALALAPVLLRSTQASMPDALRYGEAQPFSFDHLIDLARSMAAKPYVAPPRPDPGIVQQIDYDAYGKIRFRPELALYGQGGGAYPITFMHVGNFFPKTVRMHAVEGGMAREIVYSPDYFSMPDDHMARGLGPEPSAFAGFWVREGRSRPDWATAEPFATFLGASYYRTVGEHGQVGMSARGITLSPGGAEPEEFPDFTQYWFEPAPDEASPLTVMALLDGPSIAGAYRMLISRTGSVTLEIEKHLFLRRDVARLGIAPLTSMYWFGESNRPFQADWRPEVHDSDGLALWTGGGERIFRPLNNPSRITFSSFWDENPKGFGLSQRDRDLDHYLDGVRYEDRPSTWVEPLEPWGKGIVQLLEIPTDDEIHDNINVYWLPEKPARAGDALSFRYRQHWQGQEPGFPDYLARGVSVRVGRGGQPGKPRPHGVVKFMVEFEGKVLEELWGWNLKAEPVISPARGTVSMVQMEPSPGSRRWRVTFDLEADGNEPCDIRLYLRAGDRALSETWLYQHHWVREY